MNFDIAIIGGGPAGYTAAERAGANGLKPVIWTILSSIHTLTGLPIIMLTL